MELFNKYFSLLIIILYFVLGVFLLVSPAFTYLNKEIKVIFAIFLFLYGGFRLIRILGKSKGRKEE